MKKRGRARRENNVIFFPDLEKRLTEKGLESLQKKKFKDAVLFFEEARGMDPENADTLIGLVLAYFEAGSLKDAKQLAKDMLNKGIGDYFQMVDLYVMILIQLHEYPEVVHTLEVLLDEKEIPSEKREHFLTILQFSKKMADSKHLEENGELQKKLERETSQEALNLFAYQDPREQMLLVAKLANQNIRPYIHDIKVYLISESGHPFLKSMLLNVLKEQEYDREVSVMKLGIEKKFIPIDLPDIQSQTKQKAITRLLGEFLENNDPVLFENIKSLVERHFFLVFPYELEPNDPRAWAAAYHDIASEYHGMNADSDNLVTKYGATLEDFEKARIKIKEIEEISYPII